MNNLKEIEEKKEDYYTLGDSCFYIVLSFAIIGMVFIILDLALLGYSFLLLELLVVGIQAFAFYQTQVCRNKYWDLYNKIEDEKRSLKYCEGK